MISDAIVIFLIIVILVCGAFSNHLECIKQQKIRTAICDGIRARGVVVRGTLEEMDGLPGPSEKMPESPGDTPCVEGGRA